MSEYGVGGGGVVLSSQMNTSGASAMKLIVASTTPGVPGAWVEIITAVANEAGDWVGFWLTMTGQGSAAHNHLVEIGVGGSGSEETFFTTALFEKNPTTALGIWIPQRIPGGVRVAARITDSSSSAQNIELGIYADLPSFASSLGLGNSDVMGIGVSGNGVDVDPGGTANTLGSWVEIEASTDHHYKALMMFSGSSENSAMASADNLLDIGIGPAGSEEILIQQIYKAFSAQEFVIPQLLVFDIDIASGVRLSARAQCNIIDATDRLSDVGFIGFF